MHIAVCHPICYMGIVIKVAAAIDNIAHNVLLLSKFNSAMTKRAGMTVLREPAVGASGQRSYMGLSLLSTGQERVNAQVEAPRPCRVKGHKACQSLRGASAQFEWYRGCILYARLKGVL